MRETLNQWKAAAVAFFSNLFNARLSGVAAIALVLSLAVLLFNPHLLGVTLYKLSLVVLAVWLGYRIDRAVFPYARPHVFFDNAKAEHEKPDHEASFVYAGDQEAQGSLSTLRRAIIIAAVVLAIALGA